jgi:hypothetical protein
MGAGQFFVRSMYSLSLAGMNRLLSILFTFTNLLYDDVVDGS